MCIYIYINTVAPVLSIPFGTGGSILSRPPDIYIYQVYTYIYIHIYILHIYIQMYTYIYICTNICTNVYIYTYQDVLSG